MERADRVQEEEQRVGLIGDRPDDLDVIAPHLDGDAGNPDRVGTREDRSARPGTANLELAPAGVVARVAELEEPGVQLGAPVEVRTADRPGSPRVVEEELALERRVRATVLGIRRPATLA